MPIKELVHIAGDNAKKLEDAIREDQTVVLQFTPAELRYAGHDPLTPLLLTPMQAKALRAARESGADFHLKFTPNQIRMQSGGGIWDMVKGFGTSVLKSAAQGAMQGAVNHLTGGPSSDGGEIHLTHVKLTDSQKTKIRNAYKNGKDLNLRVKSDHMDGLDKIPLSDSEHRKFHSSKKAGKAVTVTVEHRHLVEKGGDLGSILKTIGSVVGPILSSILVG